MVAAAPGFWRFDARRIIVPVSDEGSCQGDDDGCTTDLGTGDRDAVENAIVQADQKQAGKKRISAGLLVLVCPVDLLNPWSALLAAAVAVPLLLLLYFLKLRRHTTRIASTMLWRKSTEDLQANVPFQRLRWSALLLLQMLALLAILGALARPVVQAAGTAPGRIILLIDCSASMNATDGGDGRSRLDAARSVARQTVDRLGRRAEPVQMMIVAFASSAQVVSGFESNRALLLEAIDSIEPTDEQADLEQALALAGAFAGRDESAEAAPPEVVLISDGGVGPPAGDGGFTLRAGGLRFVGVGPASDDAIDNVGIAGFSARRDYRAPDRVLVFARLLNAGPLPVETTATLRLNGDPAGVKPLKLPPATDDGPGEAPVSFELEAATGAVLTLRLGGRDALAADSTAALVLRPPAAARIGLVHAGDAPDPFLLELLEAMEPQRLMIVPADESGGGTLPWDADQVDLVVYDRASPGRLPNIPTLTFGAAPDEVGVLPPRDPGGKSVLSWDRRHPLLRHVSLDTLVYSGFGGFDLPAGWTPLAFGPDGPIIAARRSAGVGHVIVGPDLQRTNWPLQVSIIVFMHNVVEALARIGDVDAASSIRAGEPVTVRVLPGVDHVSIEGPLEADVEVSPEGVAVLPPLRRTGVYTVRGAVPPLDTIAVNVQSDVESDLRPRRTLNVNAASAEAGAAGSAAPLELWPWLAWSALGLLVVEWVVYCLKVRG